MEGNVHLKLPLWLITSRSHPLVVPLTTSRYSSPSIFLIAGELLASSVLVSRAHVTFPSASKHLHMPLAVAFISGKKFVISSLPVTISRYSFPNKSAIAGDEPKTMLSAVWTTLNAKS